MKKTNFIFYIFLIAATSYFSSCQDKFEKDLIKVGTAFVTETYSMTVLDSDISKQLGPFNDAPEGKSFFNVEIEYINISPDDQLYFATQFTLMDPDSVKYSPLLSGKIPEFGTSGTIKPGSQQKGWVSYEVPETAERFQLVFRSDLVDGDTRYFSVK